MGLVSITFQQVPPAARLELRLQTNPSFVLHRFETSHRGAIHPHDDGSSENSRNECTSYKQPGCTRLTLSQPPD
jgi:hypothetical protein